MHPFGHLGRASCCRKKLDPVQNPRGVFQRPFYYFSEDFLESLICRMISMQQDFVSFSVMIIACFHSWLDNGVSDRFPVKVTNGMLMSLIPTKV
jgi:hypothetical protein